MVTLYRDKKQPAYAGKEYKFKLREANRADNTMRTVGVVTVDMATHLTAEATSCATLQLVMETDDDSGLETAAMMVELSWSFVKEGRPDDDDVMSTQSAEEEIEDIGPEDIDASYRMPIDGYDAPDGADDEPNDGDGDDDDEDDVDTSGYVPMKFSVFLQEEGEEDIIITGSTEWSLDRVRDAIADDMEMEGRGLWVFMADGGPIDPEEEGGHLASALNILATAATTPAGPVADSDGHGEEHEDDVDYRSVFNGRILISYSRILICYSGILISY